MLNKTQSGGGPPGLCIMGAATELFLDDYPSALERVEVENPYGRMEVHVVDFHRPRETVTINLPHIVQRELGLATPFGQFQMSPQVLLRLGEAQNLAPTWNSLVAYNDAYLDWPLIGDLLEMPAPKLFAR